MKISVRTDWSSRFFKQIPKDLNEDDHELEIWIFRGNE